ncbi:MAG TPA: type IV toxin-antitoxin system AbiEi family antitoxin domain-containing protein [Micromonosporaceae bacterium]|nr:type IV toxin-antitoxin system AbiEi family antitoxin domain-containing protein [Micromonosporaceae bacterium]
MDDKARLHALADRQGGLITRAQARACGYSMYQVRRRLAAGEWQHVLGTVYTVRPTQVTPQLRDAAALLAVPSGVLAGPSAARRLGIRVPDSGTYLWIGAGRGVGLPGVTYLRSPLSARDRWPAGDAVVTATGRTVFDCLLVLADADALNLLDDALRERWTSLGELARRVREHAGRPGAPRLVGLMRKIASGARSEAERRAVALLHTARISGWVANHRIRDAKGALIAVGDLVFPAARLIVELDGRAFHATADRFAHDRERQNRLVAEGWTVLRFTWYDLTGRPEYVIDTIRTMLSRASTVGAQ